MVKKVQFESKKWAFYTENNGNFADNFKNFCIEKGFYPLGSCTMKYNPKINEYLSSLESFANLHPLQSDEDSQGALELMYNLQEKLKYITGMDKITLQPAAGAHGELTGMMVIKK